MSSAQEYTDAMASQKLAPELRRLLAGAEPVPATTPLPVMISAKGGFRARHVLELLAAGVTTGPSAGSVMAARIPLNALATVVALPFVDYVELARPIHLEDRSVV